MSNKQRSLILALILFSIYTFGLAAPVSLAEKPHLISVTPLSQTAIQLRFDQTLDRESAEDVSHYKISPEIAVEWANLDARMNIVRLYTTSLEIDKRYTMTVQGISDQSSPPNVMDARKDVPISLPAEMEITFGEGETVTFSGVLRDTSLIVDSEKKMRNHNAGGEEYLLCTPIGGVFFVAFELIDAFEEIGVTQADQLLDASISLYAESIANEAPQQIIIRRVLLPWKEGQQKSQPASENDLTYNSALHRNLPWNKPPAQAMLAGVNGDRESDYNGSEDVAHRIDTVTEISDAGKRYFWKGDFVTDAFRFWLANPDYNYGYLFALRNGAGSVRFSSKEHPDGTRRPMLTIRYKTTVENR